MDSLLLALERAPLLLVERQEPLQQRRPRLRRLALRVMPPLPKVMLLPPLTAQPELYEKGGRLSGERRALSTVTNGIGQVTHTHT